MSDREKAQEICGLTNHRWVEEYYGIRCEQCGLFYPDGLGPWMPLEDDRFDDDGEPDFTLDELEWQETYPELCGDDDDF